MADPAMKPGGRRWSGLSLASHKAIQNCKSFLVSWPDSIKLYRDECNNIFNYINIQIVVIFTKKR